MQCRWRPYRVECTRSLPTSEVKRRRARLVLGWGTAREDLRVLSAFAGQQNPARRPGGQQDGQLQFTTGSAGTHTYAIHIFAPKTHRNSAQFWDMIFKKVQIESRGDLGRRNPWNFIPKKEQKKHRSGIKKWSTGIKKQVFLKSLSLRRQKKQNNKFSSPHFNR